MMGFNKRYVNESIIKDTLKDDGLQFLIAFIRKADALIIEDELSEKVCKIIQESEDPKILEQLLKLDLYGKL